VPELSRPLATLLKWAWIACVLAVCLYIVWRSRADIAQMLREMSGPLLAASFAAMLGAKLLLGENARLAARRVSLPLGYWTASRLYNLSQLGKYLPGSIWQFVGRAAAYRNLGGEYGQIRDSLLVETAWIIAGAMAIALLLCGPSIVVLVHGSLSPGMRWWLLAFIALVAATAVVLAFAKRALFLRLLRISIPTPRVLLVQAGIWLLLGLSFWVLVRACDMPAELPFSVGLFAAAYAVGFLVPFAPAGLGVRDGILVVGLLPYATAGEALAVTVVARLVYLIVELALVFVQESLAALRARSASA